MEDTGLQKLRTKRDRCQLCRSAYAEANVVIEVRTLGNEMVRTQEVLACGECAHMAYMQFEMALERVMTMAKEEPPAPPIDDIPWVGVAV